MQNNESTCPWSDECINHIRESNLLYKKLDSGVIDSLPYLIQDIATIKENSQHFQALREMSTALLNLSKSIGGATDGNGKTRFNSHGKWWNIDHKTLVILALIALVALKELSPTLAEFKLDATGARIVTTHQVQPATTAKQ